MTFSSVALALTPPLYLRHGEASGTTMVDSSGNGRNGTYVNSPTLGATGLLTGDADTAVALNGTTQYGQIAYASWMNAANLSWHARIKPSSIGAVRLIHDRHSPVVGIFQFRIHSTGQLHLVFWTADGVLHQLFGTTILAAGTEYSVGAKYDGTTAKVFVNGVLDGSLSVSGSMQVGTAPFTVGANWSTGGASTLFAGTVDESLFFTSALADGDFLALHNAAIDAGSAPATGTLAAVLPALTATIAGTYTPPLVTGSLAATLPAVTASLAGAYTAPAGPVTGTLAATLPALTATLTGTYTAPPSSAPANDNLANAAVVTLGPDGVYTSAPVDNTDATIETWEETEPYSTITAGERTVWWKYTPTADDFINVDTELTTATSGDPDTILDIFSGTDQTDMVELAEDDDGATVGLTSRIDGLAVTAGTNYFFRVDGFTAGLQYVLRVTGTPPAPVPDTNLTTVTANKVNGRNRSGRLNLRIVNPLDADATDEGVPAADGSTVRLHKQPYRIISPSLPAPTLVDGRPQ